jgi:hypothetical protein
MTTYCYLSTSPDEAEAAAAADRLFFLRGILETYNLSHRDLAKYTGYTHHSVSGWFTEPHSPRHRDVPARAVDRLRLELQNGHLKGSK